LTLRGFRRESLSRNEAGPYEILSLWGAVYAEEYEFVG
jgi:hypothetical protein